MGRNIVSVICEMMKVIPQDEIIAGSEVDAFVGYLKRISHNAIDCSENEQWKLWGRLSNLIHRYNYVLETEEGKWGRKIIELLIDGPIEKYNKPSQPRRRPRDGQSLCSDSEENWGITGDERAAIRANNHRDAQSRDYAVAQIDRRAIEASRVMDSIPIPNGPSNAERLALSAVTTTAPLSHSQLLERLCADLGSSQIAPILHSEFVLSQIMHSDWSGNTQIIGRTRGPNSDQVMVVRLNIDRESLIMLINDFRSSMRCMSVNVSVSSMLTGSRIVLQRLITAGARIVAYSPAYNFTGIEPRLMGWLNDSER